MNWQPLLEAGPIVYGHAFTALAAVLIGALQFALPKGTTLHRGIGALWVTMIAGVALSSFFIQNLQQIGPFSWIHLLSIFTLFMAFKAISAARAHQIEQHKRGMIGLYVLALLLTGAFTLLPGRIMHAVIFG